MKSTKFLVILFVLSMLITACAPAEVVVEEAVLTVGEQSFTQTELEALGIMSVDYTNKDGETTTFSGVPLVALLEDAGLTGSGNLVFTALDGYQAEMDLEEALNCTECIVSIEDNSLRMVMPEMSSKLQVKDVIEISVK